jgi:hypothetical protein
MALPASKYETLCAIVAQMRNAENGLVKPEPLANACGYPLHVVMQNFGFFTSAGILNAGMNKDLSENGSLLSYALASGDSEQIILCWRTIIDRWPEMLRLLSWLRINEETEIVAVMAGAEALFHRDPSSSRFALNCLVQMARQLGYVDVVEKKVFVSEYTKSLFEPKTSGVDGDCIKKFPGRPRNLSVVPAHDLDRSSDKGKDEGIHIHLHFGSGMNPAQIDSIFRSLAESVLRQPDVAATNGHPAEGVSISAINL